MASPLRTSSCRPAAVAVHVEAGVALRGIEQLVAVAVEVEDDRRGDRKRLAAAEGNPLDPDEDVGASLPWAKGSMSVMRRSPLSVVST
jgi:hypothetical protein